MRGEFHQALLIHSLNGNVHISAHEIEFGGKTPTLGAGRVFSRGDVDALCALLSNQKSAIRILPDGVLFASPDLVVLHIPSADPLSKRCDLRVSVGHGETERVRFQPPSLVVAVTHKGARIVATGPSRPNEASPVYLAPLPNMTRDSMCTGNTGYAPRPDMDLQHLLDITHGFLFETTCTHGFRVPVADKVRRAMRPGRNCDELAFFRKFAEYTDRQDRIDESMLVPLDQTLGEWLGSVLEGV